MLNRFVSVLGACGLIIVLTGIVPMAPTYGASFGSNCSGTGCLEEDNSDNCKGADYQPSGACTGDGCSCTSLSWGCRCQQ
jgi:hypothetical protein